MALYLSRESFDRQMEKIKQVLLLLFRSLPAIALLLCVLAGIVLTLFPEIVPPAYKFLLRLVPQSIVAALAAVFILGMFLFHLRSEPPFTEILPDVKLAKSIFSIYVSLLVVFVYVIPTASQFRTIRYTFRQMMLRAEQMRVPDENIYFYQSEPRDAIYYLNRKTEIAVIEDEEELEKLRREKPGQRILLIAQNRKFEDLPGETLNRLPVTAREPAYPWDSKDNLRKNYVMRMILPDNRKIR